MRCDKLIVRNSTNLRQYFKINIISLIKKLRFLFITNVLIIIFLSFFLLKKSNNFRYYKSLKNKKPKTISRLIPSIINFSTPKTKNTSLKSKSNTNLDENIGWMMMDVRNN